MRILYSHYLAEDTHPAVLMVESTCLKLRKRGDEVFVDRSAPPQR